MGMSSADTWCGEKEALARDVLMEERVGSVMYTQAYTPCSCSGEAVEAASLGMS